MSCTRPYWTLGSVRSTNSIRTVAGAAHAKSKRILAVSSLDDTSSVRHFRRILQAGWIGSGSLLHYWSLLSYQAGGPPRAATPVHSFAYELDCEHALLSAVRAQAMTKYFSTRIMTDVFVILVSVAMITIAVTSLGEPIRAGIAASIPTPFDLAMGRTLAIAEPGTPKLAQAQPKCRLRSAPLQWNVDWLFRPPVAPG
ncbi:hypothetical protein ACVJGD_007495 [Bradyrhizobium sp. USDA 10063]